VNVTPKFGPGLKLPSPRIAKLVAVPLIVPSTGTFSVAPTDWKLTRLSVGPAPVLIWKPVAESVRNEPRLSVSLSAVKTSDWKPWLLKVKVAETATPSPLLSVIEPLIGLPGRNWTPPEETVMPLVPPAPVEMKCVPVPSW
jgi:hypothetical protein